MRKNRHAGGACGGLDVESQRKGVTPRVFPNRVNGKTQRILGVDINPPPEVLMMVVAGHDKCRPLLFSIDAHRLGAQQLAENRSFDFPSHYVEMNIQRPAEFDFYNRTSQNIFNWLPFFRNNNFGHRPPIAPALALPCEHGTKKERINGARTFRTSTLPSQAKVHGKKRLPKSRLRKVAEILPSEKGLSCIICSADTLLRNIAYNNKSIIMLIVACKFRVEFA